MTYDVFTYNGETDILEIRLNILDPYVDRFVIVEAPLTFSGNPKPLYFKRDEGRFAKFLPKIQYYVVDENDPVLWEMAEKSPNTKGAAHWKREFVQKESIKKALVGLNDEDIVYVGDVDEIWKPKEVTDDKVYKLRQLCYSYYLNNRSSEKWVGTVVTKYKNIKNACLNELRVNVPNILEDGGWHFTSQGGIDEVRRKLNDSYTKDSYNTEAVQKNLEKRFGKKDFIGRIFDNRLRPFKFWVDESDLPLYLKENKERYKNLFKP